MSLTPLVCDLLTPLLVIVTLYLAPADGVGTGFGRMGTMAEGFGAVTGIVSDGLVLGLGGIFATVCCGGSSGELGGAGDGLFFL